MKFKGGGFVSESVLKDMMTRQELAIECQRMRERNTRLLRQPKPPKPVKIKPAPGTLAYAAKNYTKPKDLWTSKFVYLLFNPEYAMHKIGVAENVVERCKRIIAEIPLPFTLEIVIAWETTQFLQLEKALLNRFAEKRVKGTHKRDWFKFSDEDVAECYRFVEAWLKQHLSIPIAA